jgi:hypothetical protein
VEGVKGPIGLRNTKHAHVTREAGHVRPASTRDLVADLAARAYTQQALTMAGAVAAAAICWSLPVAASVPAASLPNGAISTAATILCAHRLAVYVIGGLKACRTPDAKRIFATMCTVRRAVARRAFVRSGTTRESCGADGNIRLQRQTGVLWLLCFRHRAYRYPKSKYSNHR